MVIKPLGFPATLRHRYLLCIMKCDLIYMSMKLATLNLHMEGPNISKRLVRIIRDHHIDVLCVQECPRATANAVKQAGLTPGGLGLYVVSHRGLSVFSVFPIKLVKVLDLGRYHKAAMMVRVCGHGIVNLHLDHLSEDLRLKQISRVLRDFRNVQYIVGDFNSLNEQDYTEGQWQSIQSSRQRAKLQAGASLVINKCHEAGYNSGPYVGPTTPYDTRVDYILKTSTYTSHSTENIHILFSDHDMVMES